MSETIVSVQNEDGLIVRLNGVSIGSYSCPAEAGVAFAAERAQTIRLREKINKFAAWMNSLTPDEVETLTATELRNMAEKFREPL